MINVSVDFISLFIPRPTLLFCSFSLHKYTPNPLNSSLHLPITLLAMHQNTPMAILSIIIAIVSLSFSFPPTHARIPGVYSGGPWQSAHATFYGGSDASGTMGMYIIYTLFFLFQINVSSFRRNPVRTTAVHKI